MKNFVNRRLGIVLVLLFVFFAPGLTALFVYTHPGLFLGSTTNKGTLIQSSVKMIPLGDKPLWHLIYWSPTDCEQACVAQLEKLSRIRLALGRRFYDVDEWLLLDMQGTPDSSDLLARLKEQKTRVQTLPAEAGALKQLLQATPAVYIVSPDLDLVLTYTPEAPSDDIYKDIKHLLSNFQSRSAPSNVH